MNNTVYRPSTKLFIFQFIIGLLLCVILIGIPILIVITIRQLTTSLSLKEDGLEFKTGWLNVRHEEISFNKINSVKTQIDLFGKWLGYGTIQIYTGNDRDSLRFHGVDRAVELKKQLEAKRDAVKPAAVPVQAHAPSSVADELTKLAKLKQQNVITQEEFDKKKAELLA